MTTKTIPTIGIDLGTTNSCVAVYQNGKVEIITNEHGSRVTPSCVAFTKYERLIGEAAQIQISRNPQNTVFDAKRLIGCKFNDENVQNDIEHWPFEVIDVNGSPKICVKYCGEKRDYFPEEISAMVLGKMKDTAETYLEGEVVDAVITVPAYFNDAQRRATKDAGKIAGLNVLKIINEPTAAALAYGMDKNIDDEKLVLVFDLGGGTFDVSILRISKKGIFEVLSTIGDLHLGGEDFDNRLVDYLANEVVQELNVDIKENPRALQKLKRQVERVKRTLSTSIEANVEIEESDVDFSCKITRAYFENLCADLFETTLDLVKTALSNANLKVADIDDIVLVGGSTRIPKLQQLLQDLFNGKKLNASVNADEAVAYGAAIQAAVLGNQSVTERPAIVLLDVTPLSLGICVKGGAMSTIIGKNTPIPCERTATYVTSGDYQTELSIKVYEGERVMVDDNIMLGQMVLTGLTRALKGETEIIVILNIDADGILNVTAKEINTGKMNHISIENNMLRHSQFEIDKMIAESQRLKEEDKRHLDRIKAQREFEDKLYEIQRAVKKMAVKQNSTVNMCLDYCVSCSNWLRSKVRLFRREFEARQEKLEELYLMVPKTDATLPIPKK